MNEIDTFITLKYGFTIDHTIHEEKFEKLPLNVKIRITDRCVQDIIYKIDDKEIFKEIKNYRQIEVPRFSVLVNTLNYWAKYTILHAKNHGFYTLHNAAHFLCGHEPDRLIIGENEDENFRMHFNKYLSWLKEELVNYEMV